MIRSKLPQCRQCGCYFFCKPEEKKLFEALGVQGGPSRCSYCQQQALDKLVDDACKDPAKRVEYPCDVCHRTFAVLPMYHMRKDEPHICPECSPFGVRFYPDAIIRLNQILGYPR